MTRYRHAQEGAGRHRFVPPLPALPLVSMAVTLWRMLANALGFGALAWLATGAVQLLVLPAAGPEAGPNARLRRDLPRAGAWTGLGATTFTLLPVAVATSCRMPGATPGQRRDGRATAS
ncbi:hypothetical protein HUK65_17360 [Rhodobacteraceae bacterium 2376]|uniref:Uncharacterized protein n=1 Tax=Rhabdonatronobacter sediminivivens TaxID=2743469 RepID=A0A7Z0I2J2_9RHOB|nr:hypothetical protein [Rhabdonatronobacter sediminivivens]NYS26746.1 hypothetical protein [Rhabdonatronobacter sediminivivens]